MTTAHRRAALLAAASLLTLAAPAYAAGTTIEAGAATNTAEATAEAAAGDDQSTTANQAGQANDKQSLTSSDIIVIGSQVAQKAPVTASLTTTQPQSAVSRAYIDHANAGADFNQLIALTPGVSISGAANGQGFGESKAVIRGFQDGEYNVTYDSIPFADTNNPTHHSTAFFPSGTIETVVVDRGPGNASQLGQASYGGNINMYSRAASDERGGQIQGTVGNWNSFIGRFELQSGKIASLGGAKFVLNGEYRRSDGALTYSPILSKNLFFKGVIPLGDSNTLTVLSTWNRNYYYQSDVLKGATCGGFTTANPAPAGSTLRAENCAASSNIGQYGINYGMSNDPARADYWKYNRTDKTTDFSYLRLQSELGGGFSLDNRAYMYGYTNNTMSGNGSSTASCVPFSGTACSATNPGTTLFTYSPGVVITGFSGAGTPASPYVAVKGPAANVLGYNKLNKYRVLGYIGQVNYEFSKGKIRLGGWYEKADTDRHLFDFDWSNNLAPAYIEKFNNGNGTAAQAALPPISVANIAYLQHSTWNQYQLFGEFEFRPVETLAITPGIKYVHFKRGIDAAVNQKSRLPLTTAATWTKTLPFVTANWQPKPNWSFYGQYAQGMYVPDLSSFYSSSPSLGQALGDLQPMTTTNYQVGTVWHGNRVAIDVDAYIINVNNKLGTCTTAGCDTSLTINIGQVRYKGVEGQISVELTRGLTFLANASYNYARSVTTGAQIAKAPIGTATLGLLYAHAGTYVSFIEKFTDSQYANEYSGTGPRNYRIEAYGVGEFAISHDFGTRFRLGATVSNVFNSRAITAIGTGKTYGVDDQFSFLAPRSFLVDARVKF